MADNSDVLSVYLQKALPVIRCQDEYCTLIKTKHHRQAYVD